MWPWLAIIDNAAIIPYAYSLVTMKVVELVSDAQEYAELHGAIFVETSAKTAINVAALFLEIS